MILFIRNKKTPTIDVATEEINIKNPRQHYISIVEDMLGGGEARPLKPTTFYTN